MHRGTPDAVRDAAPDSPESVLARGHLWLRFPAALEQRFIAETLEPRRRLLMGCALLGHLGVVLGSGNVNEATPEIASVVWQLVWTWMALGISGLFVMWFAPARLRRAWHAESITALLGTAMGVMVIWMANASRADTAITHSSMAAIPVMYACIAARLRFYWSLASALVSIVAYAAFVHGHTPQQAQIAAGILQLMALSYVFALATNYAFEYRERRNWLLHQVDARQREALRETLGQLQQLSIQDPLTGLDNRRQFDRTLAESMAEAAQSGRPLAVLAIDVDDFKRYNDTYGHPAGDLCLSEVARIMATVAKTHGARAARLGGEEFAIVLPGHGAALARQAGESVCQAIAAVRMPHRGATVTGHVTVSVGLANWLATAHESAECLLWRADQALYQAKREGRNRLCVAPADPAEADLVTLAPRPATLPAAAPEDTAQERDERLAEAASQAEEALCQRTLDEGFRTLRFPAALEGAYVSRQGEARARRLVLTTMIGLLIYNAVALYNRALFADIHEAVLDCQLWLSVGVVMMTAIGYVTPWPLWREGVYSLTTVFAALVSTWMFSQSHLTSTLTFSVSLMLIPMFSGVAARQPLRFTLVPSIATCVAAALMLKPQGPVQAIVYGDNLFTLFNNMAYTLILSYALEHGSRKEWLLRRIDALQRQALMRASQRLKALSVVDPLTGICNRRQFEDDLDRIWREHLADQRHVGMLILDVDHFKLYNDRQGHLAGDDCLRRIATLISETAQADKGLAARLGGEEFGVLLPGAGLAEALRVAERIRAAVSEARIDHDYAPSRHVTLSVGVASIVPQAGVDPVSLFATADKALYEAKRAGRNRVAGPQAPEPSAALRPHPAPASLAR